MECAASSGSSGRRVIHMSPIAHVINIGHWSVATRIIVACVGIALVFAGATTAIGYIKASAGLTEQGNARLNSDATVVARIVDDWNAKHLEQARSAATLPVLVRALQAGDNVAPEDVVAIESTLNSFGTASTDGSGISIVDAAGNGRWSATSGSIAGRSFLVREYYQR